MLWMLRSHWRARPAAPPLLLLVLLLAVCRPAAAQLVTDRPGRTAAEMSGDARLWYEEIRAGPDTLTYAARLDSLLHFFETVLGISFADSTTSSDSSRTSGYADSTRTSAYADSSRASGVAFSTSDTNLFPGTDPDDVEEAIDSVASRVGVLEALPTVAGSRLASLQDGGEQTLSCCSPTWDVSAGRHAYLSLTGDAEITLSGEDVSGASLRVCQDGTGGRTLAIDTDPHNVRLEPSACTELEATRKNSTNRVFSEADPVAPPAMYFLPLHQDSLLTLADSLTFRMMFTVTVDSIKASLKTSSTSGGVELTIREDGVEVFSTRLTVDQDETDTETAATPAVLSDRTWDFMDEITIAVTDIGTGAAGLVVYIYQH